MKKTANFLGIWAIILICVACPTEPLEIEFEDVEKFTIYDYITQNQDQYSSFLSILEKGGLDKTLSSYNPNGDGYTLFLPTNEALDSFIDASAVYGSLQDLLNDEAYVRFFCRYHVVNKAIDVNDFPFGALQDFTLTEDYLTVSFINETDTSYYKINNQAPVIQENIELSNGFVHILSKALVPINYTAYDWLGSHEGYSLFKKAADTTGFDVLLNGNPKIDENALLFTLFLEHDSVYAKRGIYTFSQLADLISPGRSDFSNPLNPLYNFVGYHILTQNMFLTDFMPEAAVTNYSTYSDIPVHVNGSEVDIMINKGKEMFDTIVHSIGDTTFINYVGIYYDASNVLTQSGVIHMIDQILQQHAPSRAIQYYELYERPLFDEYNNEIGSFLIEDSTLLNVLSYSGTDLFYVREPAEDYIARSNNYLFLNGDFSISFTIPKLVQGNYTVFIQADFYNPENAVVDIFIDGKPIGGTRDLAGDPAASNDRPFIEKELGDINFLKYESHTITVKSLIPGRFSWDYMRFEPI